MLFSLGQTIFYIKKWEEWLGFEIHLYMPWFGVIEYKTQY